MLQSDGWNRTSIQAWIQVWNCSDWSKKLFFAVFVETHPFDKWEQWKTSPCYISRDFLKFPRQMSPGAVRRQTLTNSSHIISWQIMGKSYFKGCIFSLWVLKLMLQTTHCRLIYVERPTFGSTWNEVKKLTFVYLWPMAAILLTTPHGSTCRASLPIKRYEVFHYIELQYVAPRRDLYDYCTEQQQSTFQLDSK